jgi:hypothetical protein
VPPLPPAPPELAAPVARATLDLRVSSEVEPPRDPRLALLLAYASDGREAIAEAWSTPIADRLPADAAIELADPPPELAAVRLAVQGEAGADPAGPIDQIPLAGRLVLYDDRNGDRRAGIGTTYFGAPPPSGASDDEEAAYYAARADYYDRYGNLDFFPISSPTDPANEIVAASELVVWIGRDERSGASGYRLIEETRRCDDQASGDGECVVCWTEEGAASFAEVHELRARWTLDRVSP